MASMSTSFQSSSENDDSNANAESSLDVAGVLSADVPGLNGSVEGALQTLLHLLAIPKSHLRRATDAIALLAPNAALFLCQLLCLPSNGMLGPSFQRTAISLIEDIARHIRDAVRSPQDTLALHVTYLDSLLALLEPAAPRSSLSVHEIVQPPTQTLPLADYSLDVELSHTDETALEAAHVLAGGMMTRFTNIAMDEEVFCPSSEPEQNLHMHGLANLIDIDYFWEMPPGAIDVNVDG